MIPSTLYRQRFKAYRTGKAKYNNASFEHNGIRYHSKLEAGYASELDLQLKSGAIKGWDRQVKLSLDVNGEHIANYYIDFLVYNNDGTTDAVEVKGFETDVWKMKWKLALALYRDKYNFVVQK